MSIPAPPAFRRMLLDMQIPDWHPDFLAKLDPAALVELYRQAGVEQVMFYCQSHTGLCNWPTRSGAVHRAFRRRDFVAEMLALLHKHNLRACGYYSVIYNNWAYLTHPDWRLVPAAPVQLHALPTPRYGHCCPNNPDYYHFVMAQIEELIGTYAFDAFFFDMVWWPTICMCDYCHERYRRESGTEIPQIINWFDPGWCRFQRRREEWLSEFAHDLRTKVKSLQQDVAVYHNFAVCLFNWTRGLALHSAQHHDFLGGDFYGDPQEQLLVSRLMINLSEGRPPEFMTGKTKSITEHVRLKNPEQLQLQAFAATASSAAFLVIDSIDPDGTVQPEPYQTIANVFARPRTYEPHLGGEPVEDIAVYFNSESKMNFTENGLPLAEAPVGSHDYPHLHAVRGACHKLQRAHLPFGVITRKQLPVLGKYAIVVLPNVLRMDGEEIDAFRAYVRQGGRLYASRYTSLTESSGSRHKDFMLAELFGCHFAGVEPGRVLYLQPQAESLSRVIAPQSLLGHWNAPQDMAGTIALQPEIEGEVLATLTLPYGYPHTGSVTAPHWASIHTYPPWQATHRPVIVRNRFGNGQVIYSGSDLETGDSEAHEALFIALIRSLAPRPFTFEAETHPAVWVMAFHQPEQRRYVLSFLHYPPELPALPVPQVRFQLSLPGGRQISAVHTLPEKGAIAWAVQQNGQVEGVIEDLLDFRMVEVKYRDVKNN